MSKIILNSTKLKQEALNPTGRQIYGMDEYIYIKSFNYDDNNAIKVHFYLLLKTGEDTFDLIANVSTPDYKYSISDGKAFTDINGYNIYTVDENGDTVYADVVIQEAEVDTSGNTITEEVIESQPVKREEDFSRNFQAFSALIIPSIFKDINNYLGYHANEDGALDAEL